MARSFMAKLVSLYLRTQRNDSEVYWEKTVQALTKKKEKPSKAPRSLPITVTDSVNGRVFTLNGEPESNVIVFYLHGGSFISDFAPQHWDLIRTIHRRTGARVIAPAYRLIPYGTVLDAFALIAPLYQEVIAANPKKKIILIGDSAGGNLSLALTEAFLSEGIQPPDELILLSPALDLTLENPEIEKYVAKDPFLSMSGIRICAKYWAGQLSLRDPRVSPLFGKIRELKRVTLFVGTDGILYPDTIKLFEVLKHEPSNRLIVGNDMIHVYPLLPIPEAKAAVDKIIETILR